MGIQELHKSLNEKDVENLYRHALMDKFSDLEVTSPFNCDGFAVSKKHKIRTLLEFKDDLRLTNKVEVCKVLAQSIFYVKKFYDKGIIPPSTIFVGDRNECFVVHVNQVLKYLDMDIDWSTAPSSAYRISELITKLIQDENINPFIFNPFSPDGFTQCVNKVKDLTDNVQRKVLVTDKNITEVFRYFEKNVISRTKLDTNELANLFVQLLVNKEDNYIHPAKRRKTVVTKAFGEVSIKSREGFESFFAHFSSSYSPSQKEKLTAVVDRIVEDTTRRKQGEFFTPAIWVDKAHEYIASVYGENWKEEYVVWDPAWGTGNLTRDYKFGELYVSTLNQSDIDTANQMGYNLEATKFQYDFLNDDYDKLPEGLRKAIEKGRQIIVLMNPPYAAANDGANKGAKKVGLSDTKIGELMRNDDMGKSTQQIYNQFLYRIINVVKSNIVMFSPPLYLTGPSSVKIRKKITDNYLFERGFMMDASNFADVKSWGLTFSILSVKK